MLFFMKTQLLLVMLLASLNLGAQSIFWTTACSDKQFCFNAGACGSGNVLMTEKAGTVCAGGTVNYLYRIDMGNDGIIDQTVSNDTCTGTFPAGTHRITWRASDNCGNATTCSYLFTIRDCQPPAMVCVNGLTQSIDPPLCSEKFNAQQFVLNISDNCTPKNQLTYGMRVAGAGSGFPSADTVSFMECDQGFNELEVWSRDAGGLTNRCNVYVILQPNVGGCDCIESADIALNGCARSAAGSKLNQYRVHRRLRSTAGVSPALDLSAVYNQSDSCYADTINTLPLGGSYTIDVWASRLDAFLNGVSTFDMVNISQHILGIKPLTSLYQLVAADVNRSGSVTTFDIVEIRKLILGINDTFPLVPSWRFVVPAADPTDLSKFTALRDTHQVSFTNVQENKTAAGLHFVGIKMGDVNRSAVLQPDAIERTARTCPVSIGGGQWKAGERLRIPISMPLYGYSGWQMALWLNPQSLELLDVEGLPEDNWRMDANGLLRLLCYDHAESQDAGGILFNLEVLVLEDAASDDALRLAQPEVFRSEAYAGDVVYRLEAGYMEKQALNSYAQPNPARGGQVSVYGLPQGMYRLQVYDAGGRLTWRGEVAGTSAVEVPPAAFGAAGLYWCNLYGAGGVQTTIKVMWLPE
jgi:hypothetical protein